MRISVSDTIEPKSSEGNTFREEVKPLMFKREFLNKPNKGSSAHIIAKVELIKRYTNDKLTEVSSYSDLQIADCSNKINLEISTRPEYYENSIYKLNTLIDTLTEIKAAFQTVVRERKKVPTKLKQPSK